MKKGQNIPYEFKIVADGFTSATHHAAYIFDLEYNNVVYISPFSTMYDTSSAYNLPLNLFEYLSAIFKYDNEDRLLALYEKKAKEFWKHMGRKESRLWYLSYDFSTRENSRLRMLNHKVVPLTFTSSGEVKLALCIVTSSFRDDCGYIEMHRPGSLDYMRLDKTLTAWTKLSISPLTIDERQMLRLSSEGLTIEQIAERMCKSSVTVKKYRQQVFNKLGVGNIAQAIIFATANDMV